MSHINALARQFGRPRRGKPRDGGGLYCFRVVIAFILTVGCESRPSQDASSHYQQKPHRELQDAASIAKSFLSHLANAQAFRVTVLSEISLFDKEKEKRPLHSNAEYDICVRWPREMQLVLKSGLTGITLICDGHHVYTHIKPYKYYHLTDAPRGLSDLVTDENLCPVPLLFLRRGIPFLPSILQANTLGYSISEYGQPKYAGTKIHEGSTFDIIKIDGEYILWELFFEQGKVPLLREVRSIHKQATNLKSRVRFEQWMINPKLTGDEFLISPEPELHKEDCQQSTGKSKGPEKPQPKMVPG